jgi:hypothetical protein
VRSGLAGPFRLSGRRGSAFFPLCAKSLSHWNWSGCRAGLGLFSELNRLFAGLLSWIVCASRIDGVVCRTVLPFYVGLPRRYSRLKDDASRTAEPVRPQGNRRGFHSRYWPLPQRYSVHDRAYAQSRAPLSARTPLPSGGTWCLLLERNLKQCGVRSTPAVTSALQSCHFPGTWGCRDWRSSSALEVLSPGPSAELWFPQAAAAC